MKLILLINFFCCSFSLTTDCSSAKSANLEQNSNAAAITVNKAEPSATPRLPPVKKEIFWSGKNTDFSVQWSKDNIVARNAAGKVIFSAQKFALDQLNKSPKGEADFEFYDFRYKVLNLAGSLLFLQETTSYSPQSYTNESYKAIDLTNPAAKIALTKFYSEAEIIDALNKNAQIAEDFNINKINQPKTFKEFFAAYDRQPTEGTERKIDSCYFPKNFLESFYFERLEADKVVVNLGIPCRVGMREEEAFPLELLLPSKPVLEKDLTSANFQVRLETVDGNAETLISYSAKSIKKPK